MPVTLVVTVGLVVALVEALTYTHKMSSPTMIQTAGFHPPMSTTPVPFSLPILQEGASAAATAPPTVTMSSLRGKPVVLNMWASTCTVCQKETPAIESVARHAGKAVDFVGVDTLDQKAAGLAFLQRYGVSYLQLFDPNETVGAGYDIPGLPVSVFVSSQGKVLGEYLGALNTKTLTHYLETLFGLHLSTGRG